MMTERVVLPQVTVDALQWEDCPTGCVSAGCTADHKRLVADQWVPLPEPLTVECPKHYDDPKHPGCINGRVPLPEGIYDIGKERTDVSAWNADGERRHLETTWVVPLAEGVRLRQVAEERVQPCGQPRVEWYRSAWDTEETGDTLLMPDDLYARLVSSVDGGGPPWGVLNIRRHA